jgi:ribonuclease-3
LDIGYKFKDENLLNVAVTHVSYANDHGVESNQRLEFLGDSVLSFIMAGRLYKLFPDFNEGKLTQARAALVCEKSLAEIGRALHLDEILKIGRSESRAEIINKPSILADTFEAVLGAVFLDGGIEAAESWALKLFGDLTEHIELDDFKSELQTYFQKKYKSQGAIAYELVEQSGPAHDPFFVTRALYAGEIIGEGSGKSRKKSEQNAAKNAYDSIVGANRHKKLIDAFQN